MTAKSSNIKKSDNNIKRASVKRRRLLLILLAVLISVLLLLVSAELIRSNCTLSVSSYEFHSDKLTSPFRAVLISDIHGKRFIGGNQIIYDTVKAQSPDLIMLLGDIVDRSQTSDGDIEFLRDTVRELKAIAPVYYSLGNHENQNERLEDIKRAVTDSGAILLNSEYTDIEINGDRLRICGISTFMQWDEELYTFLPRFEDTDRLKLLMCHHPEYLIWGVKDYDFDLMLCGHTHAGMVRLPFIGALYVPEQGKFPECDRGYFTVCSRDFIITAGVGNSPLFLPRFLNPSEISVVDFSS